MVFEPSQSSPGRDSSKLLQLPPCDGFPAMPPPQAVLHGAPLAANAGEPVNMPNRHSLLRVLHILGELKHSGAEMMYHAAAQAWRTQEIHCDIMSTGKSLGVMAPVLASDGCRIHHLPFSRSPRHLWRVYRFLLRSRYDVVHIDVEQGNFWYGLLARLAGTRRVFRSVHSVFAFEGLLKLRRRWQRQLLRVMGVVTITIGDSVSRNEFERFGNPSFQIPNWFDDRRFIPPTPAEREAARLRLGIPDGALVLISIGNCAEVKNHAAILRALALLHRELPVFYLHVGAEDTHGSERILAAELAIAKKVIFHGFAEDPVPLLHAADVYVASSLHEGFSCAALEAIGTGLPAILSDVPGLRDIRSICSGIRWTTILPVSIAEAILFFQQLPFDHRREMGLRGSEAIHRSFGLGNGAGKYAELYRQCEELPDRGLGKGRNIVGGRC